MTYVIGVDVGTQSVKAVLVNGGGSEPIVASAPCETTHPLGGWAEQDPDGLVRAFAESVRRVRREAGLASAEVGMLAVACQVDGLVALSPNLRPLRPAIIWSDRRATVQAASLRDAVGDDTLARRTGLNPDASHTAPKAMWLRDAEPGNYRAARWLASVGAYLNAWLTGEVVHDHAQASSTLLYNVTTRTWCPQLVGHAGLNPAQLPQIRAAREVIGPLRAHAAQTLGLSTQCRVAVGTGDDQAAALGAGAVTPGVVVDVSGTAEPVATASRRLVFDQQRLVETHAHAVEGMLLIENPGFVSGGSANWWARAHDIPVSDVFALAALAPPGSEGALFLPTLSGATAPRWNDRLRGCFAGLSLRHDRTHLARAILEGCSFALRDIVDRLTEMGLGDDELRVVGGGARSPLWLQIKADVTGRVVRVVQGEHATGAGAAMVAAVASGTFSEYAQATDQMVRLTDERVTPSATTVGLYEDRYRDYRRLFDGIERAQS